MRKAATFLLFALLTCLPLILLHTWIFQKDALLVHSIFVSETEKIKADEVREYLKAYLKKPIYGIDLLRLQADVLRHPWVKSVRIRRSLPHTLVIDPVERSAVALVGTKNAKIIDEDGEPFKYPSKDDVLDLPVVVGSPQQNDLKKAAEAILAHAVAKNPCGKIAELSIDDANELHVVFKNGLNADIGSGNFLQKWQKLDFIVHSLQGLGHELAYVHLGDYPNPKHVAVRFKA